MTKRDLSQAELDALFTAQRSDVPPPSEAFLARIAADAATASAQMAAPPKPARDTSQGGAGLWAWLSGAFAPSGLVAASLLGLWVGIAPPQSIPDPALLWTSPEDISALQFDAQTDDWYGVLDLETVEWDDG